MNPGGLKSKVKSIENIIKTNDIDFLIVSETHYSEEIPQVSSDMRPFHRNRSDSNLCKGGICIFIRDELANHATILDRGPQNTEEEFISVKLSCFQPPLIIVAMYGQQENQQAHLIKRQWEKMFAMINEYKDQGNHVILGGDLNTWLGTNFGLTQNDPAVSTGGKEVIKQMVEDLN